MENLCSFKTTLLTRTKWPDARIREELSSRMGRISFSYNGREVLFVEKGEASPGKLFFRGAPWDRRVKNLALTFRPIGISCYREENLLLGGRR